MEWMTLLGAPIRYKGKNYKVPCCGTFTAQFIPSSGVLNRSREFPSHRSHKGGKKENNFNRQGLYARETAATKAWPRSFVSMRHNPHLQQPLSQSSHGREPMHNRHAASAAAQ